MKTWRSIPFRNIINKRLVPTEEKCLRLLHNAFTVIIMPTGWNDFYHVMIEDGETGTSDYSRMSSAEIRSVFDIELSNHNI